MAVTVELREWWESILHPLYTLISAPCNLHVRETLVCQLGWQRTQLGEGQFKGYKIYNNPLLNIQFDT